MANNTLKYRRLDPELRQRLRAAWNPPVLWPLWLWRWACWAWGPCRPFSATDGGNGSGPYERR